MIFPGNTARKLFRNYEVFSEATGVNAELIKRLFVLLSTLNGGQMVNSDAFSRYAKDTAKLYIELYPWYYMPLGMHKLLVHADTVSESASNLIQFTLILLGMHPIHLIIIY